MDVDIPFNENSSHVETLKSVTWIEDNDNSAEYNNVSDLIWFDIAVLHLVSQYCNSLNPLLWP